MGRFLKDRLRHHQSSSIPGARSRPPMLTLAPSRLRFSQGTMGTHNFEHLRAEIIARSQAKTWEAALPEWRIDRIFWEQEPETCLCTHHPINEYCFLLNRLNGNEALVGNICVKRFMGMDSGSLFDGIKRIAEDETKALNEAAIDHAKAKGWINEWEYGFCVNTRRKRNLTGKQLQKRIDINRTVLARVRNARGR